MQHHPQYLRLLLPPVHSVTHTANPTIGNTCATTKKPSRIPSIRRGNGHPWLDVNQNLDAEEEATNIKDNNVTKHFLKQ